MQAGLFRNVFLLFNPTALSSPLCSALHAPKAGITKHMFTFLITISRNSPTIKVALGDPYWVSFKSNYVQLFLMLIEPQFLCRNSPGRIQLVT